MKLCYIVPEYNPKSPTHFAYLVDFVEGIKKIFDLRLIVAKDERLLMPFKILGDRLNGYRDFYVHYSFFGAFIASLVVKILGGRVFYWNCGLPWNYKRNFLRESFERVTYKLISFLVTGTEGLKKQYAARYRIPLEKIKVMPNWINLAKAQIAKRKSINDSRLALSDSRIILFVHRLSKRKGAHYLPEILEKLENEKLRKSENQKISQFPNFLLIIIGDGPERESLEFRIQNLGLERKVKFLGQVPNDELGDYYRIADVLIMPSEEEGFPHVLLESMAAGLPFVAFDVGGIKEIISPDLREYAVPAGDIDAFVIKVQKILNNKDVAAKISESETRRVSEFDIKRVIKIFEGLINNRESHSA